MALTLGSLVKALDGRGTRTRTQRNYLIPSQRWVLVGHCEGSTFFSAFVVSVPLLILAKTAAGPASVV